MPRPGWFPRSVLLLLLVLLPTVATAQHWEISVLGGYNFGGLLGLEPIQNAKGQMEGGVTTGLAAGYTYNDLFMLEVLAAYRVGRVTGEPVPTTTRVTLAGLAVYDAHLNFTYNLASPDARVRPFILLGGGVTLMDATGGRNTEPHFSLAMGAGAKVWITEKVGIRLQARYHPSYVTDEAGGIWCSPCVELGNTQYLDEMDLMGGLTVRLGREY